MMRFLCAAALCLLGCGDQHVSNSGTPADELDGDWVIDDPAKECQSLATFRESNSAVVLQKICVLTDGTFGSAVFVGTFDVDDQSITLHAQQASCANETAAPWVVGYQLNGATLTIVMPGEVRVYERQSSAPANGGGLRGAVVATGCFDQAGRFEPRPVSPVTR